MITMAAFFFALLSIVFYYVGLQGGVFGMILFCVILAILSTILGDKEHPVSSRVVSWMAVLLAAAPLAGPFIEDLKLQALNRQREKETAPLYAKMDASIEELKPAIEAYYRQTRLFPDVQTDELLQYVDAEGALRTPPPPEDGELIAPQDPFAEGSGQRMRWVAVRDQGILLVSVGQDGIAEMPLPGVSMDGPPAHPLAGFAKLGINPKWKTYDPTNGASSIGDVVRWHGKVDYDEAFTELFDAWDEAERSSPWNPRTSKRPSDLSPDPQSTNDSEAALDLYKKGEYLAALALASRAAQHRDPYEKQWTEEDRVAERTQGMALYQLGAFREAADALINYLILEPNDVTGHYYLGAAMYKGGNKDQAKSHMAAAGQIQGNHPQADLAWQCYQEMISHKEPTLPPCWIEELAKELEERE